MKNFSDRASFIRAHTRWLAVPHAPEISLFLADEATALWLKTEDELGEIGLPPPYWAFAWAGGQALARYVLDNPELVRGKRVLDIASGSGLVAIAAAKAGAARVEANDIDDFSLAAIALNAEGNGTVLDIRAGDSTGADEGWDVVLAGDMAYENDMAASLLNWLSTLSRRGAQVFIGDPGRAYLPMERLRAVAEYSVPVTRSLEDMDIRRTTVWRFPWQA